ncbi:MAG TPA: NAD(P)H-hydrate dehydratase, partial [Rhodocyclaceae bacterium]|nr:NAD(P)H-hydrate dehydratase [Rhodocyclaceae bacterium]
MQPRRLNSHKGSVGSAGVGGGALSMTGAALLAGRAALKLGAGRVYLGLLDPHARLDPMQPELMIRHPAGLLDAKLTALACGPGLGGSLEAAQFLERTLACDLPLVLDADALSLLAQEGNLKSTLATRAHATLLTPHPGEAASLLDCPITDIQNDRITAACEIARQFHSLVALKGCGTVVATPEGQWWINTTGNPGMATAGMG